jgi:hypothetical protein
LTMKTNRWVTEFPGLRPDSLAAGRSRSEAGSPQEAR